MLGVDGMSGFLGAPKSSPLQPLQGTDLQHHQFLRYSDQAKTFASLEKDHVAGRWGGGRVADQETYPGPKLLASMQRSSVCWNVVALAIFCLSKTF